MYESAKGGWLITSLLFFSLQRIVWVAGVLGQLRTGLWLICRAAPSPPMGAVNPSLASSSVCLPPPTLAGDRGDRAPHAATGGDLPFPQHSPEGAGTCGQARAAGVGDGPLAKQRAGLGCQLCLDPSSWERPLPT